MFFQLNDFKKTKKLFLYEERFISLNSKEEIFYIVMRINYFDISMKIINFASGFEEGDAFF